MKVVVPSSRCNNKFSVLVVDPMEQDTSVIDRPPVSIRSESKATTQMTAARTFKQKKDYIPLKLTLKTLDTQDKFEVEALLDSGATNCFIDHKVVSKLGLTTKKMDNPIPVVRATPNH